MSNVDELCKSMREAAEAATPGPWQIGRLGDQKMSHVVDFGPPPKSPYMVLLEGTPANPQMGGFTGFGPSGVAHADDGSSENNAAYIALANPANIIALLDERERLRDALAEIVDSLTPAEQVPPEDPAYGDRVRALGMEIGFGALMSSASREWNAWLVGNGYPEGSEFVSGPCRAVLQSDLRQARAALGDAP